MVDMIYYILHNCGTQVLRFSGIQLMFLPSPATLCKRACVHDCKPSSEKRHSSFTPLDSFD